MRITGLYRRFATQSADSRALRYIVLAACAYSAGPLLVDQMAGDSNPFIYNAIVRLSNSVALLIFLIAMISRTFGQNTTIREVLVGRTPASQHHSHDTSDRSSSLLKWWHSSLWWMIIGSFHYAFFAWSISHIDPAVTSTIYELRHLMMIMILALWASREVRTSVSSVAPSLEYRITRKQFYLASLLPIGVGLVILGQTDGLQSSLRQYLDSGLFGVILASIAMIFAGVHPAATVIYGKRMQPLIVSEFRAAPGTDVAKLQALWFTVFGYLVSGSINIPFNFVLGLLLGSQRSIDLKGLVGATIAGGLIFGVTGVLFLRANHYTSQLSINSAFYATPVLALVWLSLVGISLPRFDLFLAGASLIIGIVILIQADPDRVGKADVGEGETHHHTRLGFNSLVLAIWSFGTFVLLRDELLPHGWLQWDAPDYWALLSLSATIFALILGFRVARLTDRINKEDDETFTLLRQCEYLVSIDVVDGRILENLTVLDRSSMSRKRNTRPQDDEQNITELESAYSRIHGELLRGKQRCRSRNDSELERRIVELQAILDIVTHSKQQGRDFSEFFSLIIFAAITIVLALGARPAALQLGVARWEWLSC